MLSDYTLDTESFSEIMEEAKNMVVSLYPEWTDFNYHDPGITMLELFSWFKEGQQYFLDQIGTEHKKKYLKLLGVSPLHKKAAQAFVHVAAEEAFTVLKGTKLSAGPVCFETDRTQSIFYNKMTECFYGNKQIEYACARERLENGGTLKMFLFGENPQKGDACYIGFQKPLEAWENIAFFIQLEKKTGIKRNPIDTEHFFPMLKLGYEYFSDGMWKEIDEVTDTTYGMLQDGMIYFCLHHPMEAVNVFGREAYYIRIRVEESDADVPPVLEKIQLNVLPVVQKNTWAEYEETCWEQEDGKCVVKADSYLGIEGQNDLYVEENQIYYRVPAYEKMIDFDKGEAKFRFDIPEQKGNKILIVSYSEDFKMKKCIGNGNGFPYQEFELYSTDVITEQLEILVHEVGTGTGYSRWKRVDDFGGSKPEDRHFKVDAEEGKIIFGDCEHGMAPEGEIILLSYAETLGEAGNVKKGKINRFLPADSEKIAVWNEEDASNGENEESLEECFFRARKILKHPDTAVTYEDYEQYVKTTPGLMIESCKVIPADEMHAIKGKWEENTLCIVVKPAGGTDKRELSESYRKNILAHLEKYRMLGTKIELIAPRYVPLELCLDIVTKPHFFDARKRIQQVVNDYFEKLSNQFGAAIIYSELYGIIDMLDCVAGINEITMDIRDGKITGTQDGSILLPPNGVIELKNVQYLLTLSD